jgi:hypothetical protein
MLVDLGHHLSVFFQFGRSLSAWSMVREFGVAIRVSISLTSGMHRSLCYAIWWRIAEV